MTASGYAIWTWLPLALLTAATPAATAPDVHVVKDLVYGKGGDVELKLDLAMPKDGPGPFPAIVCIHGGGWQKGHRGQLSETIKVLASKGYVAATISYRLAPEHKFPAQIEDCKAAVQCLRANAKAYRINPDRIGAMGFSAGGHLACLLGTTDRHDGLEGNGGHINQSSRVQAVVSFFGPTDFTQKTWSPELEEKFFLPFLGARFDDRPDLYRRASPVSYATKDDPPFLFFHGTEDKLVAIRHSRILATKLQAFNIDAQVIALEGEGHGWRGEKLVQSFEQMRRFFDEKLKH
ncbi:MAG: alpha/beta hydrolase [Gemmataceae bacterium]|nr:alpha/beta hydrolase [Gemmataceae bacterium]MDW8265258.1 alpha/beta hydrolase [Gemmataceae bacterium]